MQACIGESRNSDFRDDIGRRSSDLRGKSKMSARQKLKRVIAVLGALLCVEIGFLAYQMNDSAGRVSRNLDLGNKYLLAEDYDSAISAFSKAIEIDSMNADAYIGRGDAYKAKEDYANAWADYEKAQELSGDTDILRNKIGATEITVVAPNGSGVDGAAVQLIGSDHSYDFVTDSTGQISEVIFPEKYSVEINKESFETAKTELSAESGGIAVGQIKLKSVYEKAIADYKSFISSKNNSYKIYDIDKDGYPELFFSELHYQEREAFTDIYTYSDGEFTLLDRTHDFIFWQAFPTYASYPNGNGIVQYAMGRGKEIVSVEWWDEGENRSETVYSTNFLQDHIHRDQIYYRDICDDAYENETEINHQFYQSETSCPYFEGSYLLGLSAKDNFTAVYEAFGVEAETDDSITIEDNSDKGIDLYEYRKTDVWELAEMIGGMTQGNGEGIILEKLDPHICIAAFQDYLYGTGTNYIAMSQKCEYTIGGVRVGDSAVSAEEKILALGFDLTEDGMQLYGNPWKKYKKGMEAISYHWDSSNNIEDIDWVEYHD